MTPTALNSIYFLMIACHVPLDNSPPDTQYHDVAAIPAVPVVDFGQSACDRETAGTASSYAIIQ